MNAFEVDSAVVAYINCALWALAEVSHDQDDMLRRMAAVLTDLHPDTHQRMRADVATFVRQASPHIALWPEGERITPRQLGHDLWLLRNNAYETFSHEPCGLNLVLHQLAAAMGPCALEFEGDMLVIAP